MTDEYIAQALRTEGSMEPALMRIRTENHIRLLHAVLGLGTEVGELQDAVKKYLFYGRALDITNLVEETGDILWYLALLLSYLGVNFEEVMLLNIAKLRTRYPEKFTEQAANVRDLKKERQTLEGRNAKTR